MQLRRSSPNKKHHQQSKERSEREFVKNYWSEREIHKEGTPLLSLVYPLFLSPGAVPVCPSLHPLLPFSIQSVPLSPKPNTTTPPPSSPPSLSSPPLPLAAFPTQSARRPASSPPGWAIPRRFRAIRRGFGAPLGVPRRIGGDRAPGRSGPPF